jgi:hypothetical protein
MVQALRTIAGLGIVLAVLAVGIALWPQGSGADDTIRVETRAVVLGPFEVTIDVKPGCKCNLIILHRCCCLGVIPVAIITTPDFDATTVDPHTVSFAGGALPKWSGAVDVDRDRDKDLLLLFKTRETDLTAGDTEACLDGETFDGTAIHGCDSVQVIGLGRWWKMVTAAAGAIRLDGSAGGNGFGDTGLTTALGASSAPVAPPPAGGDRHGSWGGGWPWWVGLALGGVTGAFIVGGLGWVFSAKRRNGSPNP